MLWNELHIFKLLEISSSNAYEMESKDSTEGLALDMAAAVFDF
jgi:hypothetical protein